MADATTHSTCTSGHCFTLDWSRHLTGVLVDTVDTIGSGPERPQSACALGQYLISAGVRTELLLGESEMLWFETEDVLEDEIPEPARWVFASDAADDSDAAAGVVASFTAIADQIAKVNDSHDLDLESKEVGLRSLFAKVGVRVEFTGRAS